MKKMITMYQKNNKIGNIFLLIIISFSFFMGLSLVLKSNGVYQENKSKEKQIDRFFSYDDLYYVKRIYNEETITKKIIFSVVKHPLLVYSAHKFTTIEKSIYPNISVANHYQLIIILQIITSIIGIVFLYLILTEVLKLSSHVALLLSFIYMFSNTIIMATILAESFIISATLLIASYYYLSQKKHIISGFLGLLVMGVTITNVFIWGLMVLFLIGIKNYKDIFKIFLSFIIFTIILFVMVYLNDPEYIKILFNNFFTIVKRNTLLFSAELTVLKSFKYVFYFLFSCAFFYIDTINFNQLMLQENKAISFVPQANVIITIISGLILVIIIFISLRNLFKEKDKHILTALLILLFNLWIHGILKFGLTEAYIYIPHFFFAIILLLALNYKYFSKKSIFIIFLIIVIVLELAFNWRLIFDITSVIKNIIESRII